MNSVGSSPDEARVLVFVTTKRDAEITQRLLREAGMEAEVCESLAALEAKAAAGNSVLLLTEEAVSPPQFDALLRALAPRGEELELPTVLLTPGGIQSPLARLLLPRLQNLTLLERPASISSILSAVQAAVRVRGRQRQLINQLAHIKSLQAQLSFALSASGLGTFHFPLPAGRPILDAECLAHLGGPAEGPVDFKSFYALVQAEDRRRVVESVEAALHGSKKFESEFRTTSVQGSIHWIRATGQTQRNSEGAATIFGGTTQNVTARKNLELERDRLMTAERTARLASENANRLKDEFLGTLSHELRTPLNAMVGWVDVLRDDIDNPTAIREGLDVIERNVRAQSQLIDDLLDVSRIISGKVRLEIKPVQLTDVLRAAIETVVPAASAKGVRLQVVMGTDCPAVSGDFVRLQQVIWNLLTNAVKFTPKGGRVQLLLEQVNSSLTISITDTGAGIAPDFLPHVFERFRQADGSPSRRSGGLGLGLSIVKTLVEMHGGSVSVQSAGLGQGSCFSVTLPLRMARVSAFEEPPPRINASAPATTRANRPDLDGITVLVVDDEPDARGMMHRLLESCRAVSLEAASAADAAAVLSERKPDIILSDIGMPGTDGYAFISAMRRKGVETPAVALTAFARSEDRVRAIQAGFQAHLAKPIEPTELLTVVASLCGRIPRRS